MADFFDEFGDNVDGSADHNHSDTDSMEDSKFALFKIPYIIDCHRVALNPSCAEIVMDQNQPLSDTQKLDIKATSQWVRRQLEPSLLYLLFLDKDNYNDYTRKWIASKLPFPRSFYEPFRTKQRASNIIDSILFDRSSKPTTFHEHETSVNLVTDAKKCLTALSRMLENKKLFFGTEKYTSGDAVIYCYLNRILTGEWHDKGLRTHLNACDNLLSFMKEFSLRNHLPNTASGELSNKDGTTSTDLWSQMFGPTVIAIAINMIYAFRLGLIDSERGDEIMG
ncbi:Metaxin-3 [Fragariocoptes setiger]|uniref:Metaxin-3 n=1 Tax=Fragariocoptes setiger TaxID=1670756 RepID=A0ABQ7S9D9_9ACAR|nr:Metaxin-3 [Fragariocoptes setiger]